MNFWKKIIVIRNKTILETIKNLNENQIGVSIVVDENLSLLGTVTDGDIRRGLLRNFKLNDNIQNVMNKKPIHYLEYINSKNAIDLMIKHEINCLPVLNKNNKIIDVKFLDNLENEQFKDNPVFIFAGGFGKRLMPLTKNIPKPMLTVRGKPMLENIIRHVSFDLLIN